MWIFYLAIKNKSTSSAKFLSFVSFDSHLFIALFSIINYSQHRFTICLVLFSLSHGRSLTPHGLAWMRALTWLSGRTSFSVLVQGKRAIRRSMRSWAMQVVSAKRQTCSASKAAQVQDELRLVNANYSDKIETVSSLLSTLLLTNMLATCMCYTTAPIATSGVYIKLLNCATLARVKVLMPVWASTRCSPSHPS